MKKARNTFTNRRSRHAISLRPRHDWTFLTAAVVALLALGFGGCKKNTEESSGEPPSLPDPLDQKKAPAPEPKPAEPQAPSDQSAGARAQPAPDAPAPDAKAGSVSQREIEAFAQIQVKIAPLQQQVAQQAQAGASQIELQKLQAQQQKKAKQWIQESKLTEERFNEIAASAQRDPNLMRQVQTEMMKAKGGSAPQPNAP